MYQKLRIGDRTITPIDWEMTPDLSFGTYESWGGRERVRNNDERVYYFYIDAWGKTPKVCLMERGVKHAKILAEIDAPAEIVDRCVRGQGRSHRLERSYAIDDALKNWLIDTVLDGGESAFVLPVAEKAEREDMGLSLPLFGREPFTGARCTLPSAPTTLDEEEVAGIVAGGGFFDAQLNPDGRFENALRQDADERVVIDERTALMWQRGGIDITSIRTLEKKIAKLNAQGYAGHRDWRLPTLEEALSLLEPAANAKGLYLHPCFSKEQPFIFVAAQRRPGGHWFVDFKHGRAFWSSATIPGGFGRLVRTLAP